MGWSEFENEEEKLKDNSAKMKADIEKFCTMCHQLFEQNPIGKEFLGILDQQLHGPVCPPDKESSWGYFREGQNSIIRQIKNAVIYQKKKLGGAS